MLREAQNAHLPQPLIHPFTIPKIPLIISCPVDPVFLTHYVSSHFLIQSLSGRAVMEDSPDDWMCTSQLAVEGSPPYGLLRALRNDATGIQYAMKLSRRLAG